MRKDLSLKCFSPPVMIATFAIEIVGALWILYKYRATTSAKLIAAVLVFLGIFQFAEYMVCEGALGLSSLDWARVGYASISLLPALGLHLGMSIAGKVDKRLVAATYAIAVSFAGYYLTVGHGMTGQVCAGNYVIFEVAQNAIIPYALYYYGWTVFGMYSAWQLSRTTKSSKTKTALRALAIGYALFLIPTTLVNVVDPSTIAAIPSIMCGFAVLLAIALLFWVAPNACTERRAEDRVVAGRVQ